MPSVTEIYQNAVKAHQSGHLQQADQLYRRILQMEPEHAGALNLLGVIALQAGQPPKAIELISRAVALLPGRADLHLNLAAAYKANGDIDQAITRLRRALEIDANSAVAHYNMGLVLREQGQLQEAVQSYRRALELQPDNALAHHHLGVAQSEQGEHAAAESNFRRALEINPNSAESHYALGVCLNEQQRYTEGEACLRHSLQLNPNNAESHNNLGISLSNQDRLAEATSHYQLALEINANIRQAQLNLGSSLQAQGQLEAAQATLQKAAESDPTDARIFNNLSGIYARMGRRAEAVEYARKALEVEPTSAIAYSTLAKANDATDGEIARLEALILTELSEDDRRACCFGLAKTYDERGEYDRAFEMLTEGNRLKHAEFDPQMYEQFADRLLDVYSADFFAKTRFVGSPSRTPVFIVGMPRSGTTLVEQIISSHSQAHGAGELQEINRIKSLLQQTVSSDLRYPEAARKLDQATATMLADEYLSTLTHSAGDAARVTDKLPGNFQELGLIALLFPNATIIHCRRHPLDTCLSCFMQEFRSVNYAFDLTHLGSMYQQYERIMAHWRDVLPIEIHEVDYENVVDNQEPESQRLIAACGLDWEPACLEFHRNERAVSTASVWQVRKPLYSSSIGRWKHYAEHLKPLMNAMGWKND